MDEMDERARIVLVTGASRGIGAAIAKAFAAEGAIVIVNYRANEQAAQQVVSDIETAGGTAVAMQADVTDTEAVQQMVALIAESFGRLDAVVNNALLAYRFDPKQRKTAWSISWEDYERQFAGSVGGAYRVCHAAIPLMKEQGAGKLIQIVSNLVAFPVVPYHDYTTAKAALLGYSRNLASELGAFGITVNCIAPGLTAGTDSSRDTNEETREKIRSLTPLGRLAKPEDIAGAATFLASHRANFITGQCLYVDGGLVMR